MKHNNKKTAEAIFHFAVEFFVIYKPLKYINSISKIDIKCKVCGHKWDTTPASLLAGHGCPECAKKKGSSKRTYSHNVYIKKLESTNPNIEALSEYKGSKEKIVCRCKLCNNVWSVRADSLIKTKHSGCPLCSRLKHK